MPAQPVMSRSTPPHTAIVSLLMPVPPWVMDASDDVLSRVVRMRGAPRIAGATCQGRRALIVKDGHDDRGRGSHPNDGGRRPRRLRAVLRSLRAGRLPARAAHRPRA